MIRNGWYGSTNIYRRVSHMKKWILETHPGLELYKAGRLCLECGGGGEGSVESGGGAAGPQGVRVPVPPRHPALLKHPGLNIRALIN